MLYIFTASICLEVVLKRDLQSLPKFRDSWSYLYLEKCRIEKSDEGLYSASEAGYRSIPSAQISVLLLGPGTSITQAAVRAAADDGCSMVWVGEDGIRFYAGGTGESSSSRNLLRQAAAWADPKKRLAVVLRMYEIRFGSFTGAGDLVPKDLIALRGMEGARVRHAYAAAAKHFGIEWSGRQYDRTGNSRDPANHALSVANSCLYGICHAGIVSMGMSPGIGFIHTGKALSFVYDIADLYKMEIAVPVAFQEAAAGMHDLERRVRVGIRTRIVESALLKKIERDLRYVLSLDEAPTEDESLAWWDPEVGTIPSGRNAGTGS